MIPYNDHDHGGYDDLDGDDNDDADADDDDADDHESEQADLFSKKELRLKLGVDQVEHVQNWGVIHLATYLSIRFSFLLLQLISNTSQEISSWIFFFVASFVRKSLRIEIVEMLSDLNSALLQE